MNATTESGVRVSLGHGTQVQMVGRARDVQHDGAAPATEGLFHTLLRRKVEGVPAPIPGPPPRVCDSSDHGRHGAGTGTAGVHRAATAAGLVSRSPWVNTTGRT